MLLSFEEEDSFGRPAVGIEYLAKRPGSRTSGVTQCFCDVAESFAQDAGLSGKLVIPQALTSVVAYYETLRFRIVAPHPDGGARMERL